MNVNKKVKFQIPNLEFLKQMYWIIVNVFKIRIRIWEIWVTEIAGNDNKLQKILNSKARSVTKTE